MSRKLETVIPELDNAAIRRTSDGKCSVYDLISVVGGQKNPKQAWKRVAERYPEVVTKCDYFKFPGKGQRETPVTDREGWAYILGLLPGLMGRKYRESAAKLVLRYLDADIKIAEDIVDRNKNQKDLEQLEARVRSKLTRHYWGGSLKAHGVRDRGYAICTNQTYIGLFGTNAKGLRQRAGLPENSNWRDHASVSELNKITFTEDLEAKSVDRKNIQGNEKCAEVCLTVAQKVAQFTEELLSG